MKLRIIHAVLILGFSAAAIFYPAACISCAEFGNGDRYSAYENMLVEDDANILELEKGFFPTNYRPSIFLDVAYHFISTNRSAGGGKNNHTTSTKCKEDTHLRDQEELNFTEISLYHFRWVISPINLFIRPELLTALSLHTYQTRSVSIDIYLGLPFNCSPEILNRVLDPSASSCDNPPAHLNQLNRLTANLRSYAVHRSSSEQNGLQLNYEHGYSAYFFDDNPSDFCIMDQENNYATERIFINVGGMILVLAIMVATPVILVSVYDSFRVKVEKNSNMKYFVWSIATVSFFAAMLMLYFVSSTIAYSIGLYPKHKQDSGYYDIYIYFTLCTVVLVIMVVFDILLMIVALVYVDPVRDRRFPIPSLFKVFTCGCSCARAARPGEEVAVDNLQRMPVQDGEQGGRSGCIGCCHRMPAQVENQLLLGGNPGGGQYGAVAPNGAGQDGLGPNGANEGGVHAGPNDAGEGGASPNGAGEGGAGAGEGGASPNGAGEGGAGPNGAGEGGVGPNEGPNGAGEDGAGPNGAGEDGAGPNGAGEGGVGPNGAGEGGVGPNGAGEGGVGPNGAGEGGVGPNEGPNGAVGTPNGGEVEAWRGKERCECLILLFGCVSFTLFLQLSSFHSVYILLGTICTPVTTLSITSFYIATYFFFVAFVAVVLKSTDGTNLKKGVVCAAVISAILFTIFAICLVLYFYKYTVLVQGYRNTGGIFGIVGSLLPSIIVALGGWCGTRLIKCIKPAHEDESRSRNEETLNEILGNLQQWLHDHALPPQIPQQPHTPKTLHHTI